MNDIIKWLQQQSGMIFKVFLFVITISLIVALFPKEYKFRYEFQLEKPWLYEDLIAPFDFAIKKTKAEIITEKQEIISNVKPYFVRNNEVSKKHHDQLLNDFELQWKQKYGDGNTYLQLKKTNLSFLENILDSLYSAGIIEMSETIENKDNDFTVFVMNDKIAEETELGKFYTIRSADQYIRQNIDQSKGVDKDLALLLLENAITQNILYDAIRTSRETLSGINNISLTRGIVQKGERVVSKGEIVNDTRYQKIISLKEEYEGHIGGSLSFLMILVGQTILISMAIIVLVMFLSMFRKDILADNRKIMLILSLILLMVIVTSILLKRFNSELVSLVPLCLVPFIIRAFFDTRLGLFVHIITVVIIGFLVPNGFEFVFLQLIAGIVTIISVVNLEKRSQFFLTSIYIFLTYSIIYTGMNLAQDGSFENIRGNNFVLFAGSSAMTLLSFPLIYLYERVFGYVTSLSLLELSSINNKLLRELSLKAPGTFQHSLQVANLAQEAVYRIDGNALLARTGALYHDAGKLDNSYYFTENQIAGANPHNELALTESAKIIIAHVSKGVELARKFKIPEPVIDFIRTHHGTRKTGYLFSRYQQQHPNVSPEEELQFTYPGPLPFSKETAVVMMADAVEAASKSMKSPDKQSISDMVEEIIDKQVEQKQFKNSNITLKDITRVKHVFKQRLMNIYHIRIEYPK
jgi:putative nucleotidyltransferase with HDIG domain